jgi:hypothetical protein
MLTIVKNGGGGGEEEERHVGLLTQKSQCFFLVANGFQGHLVAFVFPVSPERQQDGQWAPMREDHNSYTTLIYREIRFFVVFRNFE